MGKPAGKKKKTQEKPASPKTGRPVKPTANQTSRAFDEDTAIFISMSQELKDEGNKLYQGRDHEGAMLKYEKALKLLPRNHIDVAYLRSNMASCYMQLGLGEYPRAINECNLALQVYPKYTRALLKRARCYEALNRLDLAYRDVTNVLSIETNNLSALDVLNSVKTTMIEKGISFEDYNGETTGVTRLRQVVNEKLNKKNKNKNKNKNKAEEKKEEQEDKAVIEEEKVTVIKDTEEEKKVTEDVKEEKVITKTVKLVLGEDIRWAQLPMNCSIRLVRDIVRDRYPGLNGVLVKYRDQEGDFVTITTTEELRLAELSSDSERSLRLFIAEVTPDQEPVYEGTDPEEEKLNFGVKKIKPSDVGENGNVGSTYIEDWIVQFARLFKNHVGFDSDSYLQLHELGMKLYSQAMEDTVTSEEVQQLFDIAADKFQEMAALALFNWGNVHLSQARKQVFLPEDATNESVLEQIKIGYEWTHKEYVNAKLRYEEALRIKPDFYEAYLILGQQQFEQAKLVWYHAVGTNFDLESLASQEVLDLYNKAENCMEKGMQMWEEMEEQRLNGLSKFDKYKAQLQKTGLDDLFEEIPPEEAAERAANMSSQIYLLWGTLLYERSIVEYKLELPTWEECLEVAVEKFELAGASQTDIAVMIKNHCSNATALDGLGFKIDEIIQAWNEMYDAKRWQIGVPSFRLEPLFRRQVPKIHHILEHV